MRLGAKRELFARCHAKLLAKAFELGFEVRQDELKRGEQQAVWNSRHFGKCGEYRHGHGDSDHTFHPIGSANSLHLDGLAIDLYLRRPPSTAILWATERYRELGEYWESLHELCYWGGRTDKPGDRLSHDGGHFAITHEGRQ